jgi:hypothetical protein
MAGRVSLLPGLRRASSLTFEERRAIRIRLDYEVGRARRYGGRVSVIVFRAQAEALLDGNWHRFTATIPTSLRDLDSAWIETDRITLVLPETDLAARSHVISRIFGNAEREGLVVGAWASTFPDEEPTSDALLRSVTGTGDASAR